MAAFGQTIPPKQITPSQTSGQVLTTVTAGQPPSWQTPTAGTGVSVAATSPILVNGGTGPVTTGLATISCPECGATQIQQFVNIPPIGGLQGAVVYFTATTNSGIGTGGNFAYSFADPTGKTPSSGYVAHGGCGPWNPGGNCVDNIQATYLNAVLPSYIPAASVNQVWPVAVVSSGGPNGKGYVASTGLSCTNPSGGSGVNLLSAVADIGFPLQQFQLQDIGVTGAQIPSITCTLNVTALDSVQTSNNAYAPTIALIVYYAGSAPPLTSNINIAPPLSYQPVNNVLGLTTPYNYSGDQGSVNAISLPQYFYDTGGNPRQAQPGDEIDFTPNWTNTSTTPTITYFGNTVGPAVIIKANGSPLAVGDLLSGNCCVAKVIMDTNNNWELQNPQTGGGGGGSGISGLTTGQVGIAGSATTLTSSIAFGTTGSDLLQLASGKVPVATLPLFTSGANGAVAASGGGTTNYLRADGTWAPPPGSGGSGTIVASAQYEVPYYSTSGVAQTVTGDTGTTTDGAGDMTLKTLTLNGPVNAYFNMTSAGTLPTAPGTSTIQMTVPNSVTAYAFELPGAQPSGSNTYLSCTAANPSVCSWAAGGGGGSGISGLTTGQVAIAGSATTITSSIALGTSGSDIPQLSSGLLNPSVLPLATTGAFGAVKPDGSTITISGGVISSTGGGGSGTVVASPQYQIPMYSASGTASTVTGNSGISGTGTPGFLALTSSEAFTGGARFSQGFVSNMNSLNIATEQADQQGSSIVDGVTGAVGAGSGTAVEEINGVDGLVILDTGFGALGPGAGVGVRGQCRVEGSSGDCWGGLFSAKSTSGAPADLQGVELDLNVVNTGDNVIGMSVQGSGSVSPDSGYGVVVNVPGSWLWDTGFLADAGCCDTALEVGPTAASGSSLASMPVVFDSVDSGATQRQSTIKADALGDLVLTPFSGNLVCAGCTQFSCQPGLGDGANAITAATYLQTECLNTTSSTWTIKGIKCFTDNSGSSTLAATNGAGTALLTGPITCSSSFAAGTQSGTVTIASGDFIKFTFVADGTSKQATFVVSGTY